LNGHVTYRENVIRKQVLIGEINGRRLGDHPRQVWVSTLKTDLAKIAPRMKLEEN